MGARPKLIQKQGLVPSGLFEILRDRISNHAIAPGTKLVEQVIADELDVYRARVLDALLILDHLCLVERFPGRGAVVRHLDLAVTLQVLEMRELLEGLAVRLATRNVEPSHWDDLIAQFEASAAKPVTRDALGGYVRNYELFRHRIIVSANSTTLADTLASLHDKTKVVMRRVLVVSDRIPQALVEHVHVLRAMQEKDAEMAELLRRKSISSARKYLEQYSYVLFHT